MRPTGEPEELKTGDAGDQGDVFAPSPSRCGFEDGKHGTANRFGQRRPRSDQTRQVRIVVTPFAYCNRHCNRFGNLT